MRSWIVAVMAWAVFATGAVAQDQGGKEKSSPPTTAGKKGESIDENLLKAQEAMKKILGETEKEILDAQGEIGAIQERIVKRRTEDNQSGVLQQELADLTKLTRKLAELATKLKANETEIKSNLRTLTQNREAILAALRERKRSLEETVKDIENDKGLPPEDKAALASAARGNVTLVDATMLWYQGKDTDAAMDKVDTAFRVLDKTRVVMLETAKTFEAVSAAAASGESVDQFMSQIQRLIKLAQGLTKAGLEAMPPPIN